MTTDTSTRNSSPNRDLENAIWKSKITSLKNLPDKNYSFRTRCLNDTMLTDDLPMPFESGKPGIRCNKFPDSPESYGHASCSGAEFLQFLSQQRLHMQSRCPRALKSMHPRSRPVSSDGTYPAGNYHLRAKQTKLKKSNMHHKKHGPKSLDGISNTKGHGYRDADIYTTGLNDSTAKAFYTTYPPPEPIKLVFVGEEHQDNEMGQTHTSRLKADNINLPSPFASAADIRRSLKMPRSSSRNREVGVKGSLTRQRWGRHYRNIAVQVHSFPDFSKQSLISDKPLVGGVRELRDLQMKLVLQQLRHINHMNQALDRIGGSHSSTESPFLLPTDI